MTDIGWHTLLVRLTKLWKSMLYMCCAKLYLLAVAKLRNDG